MKKEIALIVVMSSMSMMNASMNNNDKLNPKKETRQISVCCLRTYAVPPCEKCAGRSLKEKLVHIPLPLSVSQERERRLP